MTDTPFADDRLSWVDDPDDAYKQANPDWDKPAPDPAVEPGVKARGRRKRDQATPDLSSIVWPDPVDFFPLTDGPPPDLQEHHIPAALWPFTQDTAARMGVDPTSVGLAALTSAASVIPDVWQLQPKRFDWTWTNLHACGSPCLGRLA